MQTVFISFLFKSGKTIITFSYTYTHKKQRLKLTQIEKVRFIKVNEVKSTQFELFSFLPFMYAVANASELFCIANFVNIEPFLYHSNVLF